MSNINQRRLLAQAHKHHLLIVQDQHSTKSYAFDDSLIYEDDFNADKAIKTPAYYHNLINKASNNTYRIVKHTGDAYETITQCDHLDDVFTQLQNYIDAHPFD